MTKSECRMRARGAPKVVAALRDGSRAAQRHALPIAIIAQHMPDRSRSIPVNRDALHPTSLHTLALPDYWEDEHFTCVDCGKEVLFSAERQREWYEVKKRPIFLRPIRCPEHHEAWRQGRRAKFAMDRRLERLKRDPNDTDVIREAAMAIVTFHQRTKRGNLQMALHLLRHLALQEKPIVRAIRYCESELKIV